jgi:kynureninase
MYAVKSQINHHGYDWGEGLIEMEPREGEACLRTEDILSVIEERGHEIALVLFPGLQYYTGQLFDMQAIAAKAHEKGCVVGFDLAHAVGNAPLALHDWGVDFAVWCSYKYLNSGPGCIGGAFVHENHFGRGALPEGLPRVVGWWAHRLEDRFEMGPDFVPIPGAYGFRQSNPPSLLVVSLKASLDVFEAAGEVGNLRAKSELLTAFLEHLLLSPAILPEGLLTIFTPAHFRERGCQLSLSFTRDDILDEVFDKLSKEGVICDVRKPRVIRIAPTPLYNSFRDVWDFVQLLNTAVREVMAAKDA